MQALEKGSPMEEACLGFDHKRNAVKKLGVTEKLIIASLVVI